MIRINTIPIAFTRPMAARLLGVSLPVFDRIGLVPVPWSAIQPRYGREVLELVLGHPITAEMVAAAEAAHAPRLSAYRAANKNRKEAHSNV
jgi:hypothetical protein